MDWKFKYINFGVALLNLKKLRDTGKVDEIIEDLNITPRFACEQDCFNELCQDGIYVFDSSYNGNSYTEPFAKPRIYHFAGIGESFPWSGERWQDAPLVKKYREMSWDEVLKRGD